MFDQEIQAQAGNGFQSRFEIDLSSKHTRRYRVTLPNGPVVHSCLYVEDGRLFGQSGAIVEEIVSDQSQELN